MERRAWRLSHPLLYVLRPMLFILCELYASALSNVFGFDFGFAALRASWLARYFGKPAEKPYLGGSGV
jgi:hypothetical protein